MLSERIENSTDVHLVYIKAEDLQESDRLGNAELARALQTWYAYWCETGNLVSIRGLEINRHSGGTVVLQVQRRNAPITDLTYEEVKLDA